MRNTFIAACIAAGTCAASLGLAIPASAGEFGVVNRYSFSHRTSHGTQAVKVNAHSQLVENGKSLTIKTNHSTSGAGTYGNGYSDSSSIISINSGSSHFSETANTSVNSHERFNTQSQTFEHGLGSYFNR
jgi:hypothetical protein